MGRKKMLKKLSEFFDMDARIREQRKEELAELLSRLKEKENELKQALATESSPELRDQLVQKIDIVHTQRKKGIQLSKDERSTKNQGN